MQIKKVRLALVFTVLSFVSLGISAQSVDVKGRIVDAETNSPVEFANIGVEGTYLGTASDFGGFYNLTVGDEFMKFKVQISAVGYQVKELTVDELYALNGAQIKLFPRTYGIQQVEVKADSKRLYGIVKTASNIIEDSYEGAYSASVYLSQEANGDKTEAVIRYSDEAGYGDRSLVSAFDNRQYEVLEIRRDFEVSPIKKGMIYANDIQAFDIARRRGNVLDVDFVNAYKLELKDEAVIDGDSVWLIQYNLEQPDVAKTGDAYCQSYKGLIYIRQKDYTVVRNELEFVSKGFFHAGRDAYREKSALSGDYTCKVITNYAKIDGGKNALRKIVYSGSSADTSLKLEWIVYNYSDKKSGVAKSFYSDKAMNKDFWSRFTLPLR